MFRFILLAAIIYILFKWLRRGSPPARKARRSDRQAASPGAPIEEMVQDPACGTWVPVGQALALSREKETFYFCSAECREKFLQGHADGKR